MATAVLALGIGANTAMFTIVNGVLLRPLPFPAPERLLLVSYIPRDWPTEQRSGGLFDRHLLEFRRQNRAFESVTTFRTFNVNLAMGGDPLRTALASVTPEFFSVLRVNPARGKAFTAGENRTAILSDQLWRNRFGGDPSVIGRSIRLDGVPHTIIGIMPAGFSFPNSTEIWTALEIRLEPRTALLLPAIGRLKPGVSPQQTREDLETMLPSLTLFPGMKTTGMRAEIVPLQEMVVGHSRRALLIFAGAVGLVLLIACANAANLFLARAISRREEIATRSALGATRPRLIFQSLTESTLLAAAGGSVGILLAFFGVHALLALAPPGTIPRAQEIHLNSFVLAVMVAVSVLTGIAFGLVPAFHVTRPSSSRTVTGGHNALRRALVTSEIALSIVLLAGAGLLLKSLVRMRAVNPGFRADGLLVVTVEVPDAPHITVDGARAFHGRAFEKLRTLAGVRTAGAATFLPVTGLWQMGELQTEGRPLPPGFEPFIPVITPGYFATMGIPLRRGRDFTEHDDASAPGVAIVSESVARRAWPGQNPIGKRISVIPQDWLVVVGVVEDIRQLGVTKPPQPAVYQPYTQAKRAEWLRQMTFALRIVGDPAVVAPEVRAALHDVGAWSVASMPDLILGTESEPLFQTRLLSAFSILALWLSTVGIYGVLAYSVSERTREIGIRMALGAESRDIAATILWDTAKLAASGVLLGTTGALAATRVLERFLFEVRPSDPATLGIVIALLLCVALLASWVPARRAVRVDPAVTLRHE